MGLKFINIHLGDKNSLEWEQNHISKQRNLSEGPDSLEHLHLETGQSGAGGREGAQWTALTLFTIILQDP